AQQGGQSDRAAGANLDNRRQPANPPKSWEAQAVSHHLGGILTMSIPQQLQELIKQAVASGDEKALAELMATIQLAASQARAETAQESLTPEQRAELEEQRALVMARLQEEEAYVKELREERDQ